MLQQLLPPALPVAQQCWLGLTVWIQLLGKAQNSSVCNTGGSLGRKCNQENGIITPGKVRHLQVQEPIRNTLHTIYRKPHEGVTGMPCETGMCRVT
jgi:hypothetical protein